jgi:fluoroquinolone transport system permease protein
MNGLFVLAAHDARLQYRYGVYAAYAFVVAFYVLVLLAGRGVLPGWAVAMVIYTDPAAVGFFFLGALMMLEKAEGVRTALAISPVTARQYLSGKVATLAGLAMLASIILLVVHQRAPNPALLLVAVFLISICFIGIGVPIALRFRTVSGYLVGSGAFLMPVIGPAFLALLEPMPLWLALWPPVAQFRLVLIALGYASAPAVEILVLLAVTAAATAGAVWFALGALRRELGK